MTSRAGLACRAPRGRQGRQLVAHDAARVVWTRGGSAHSSTPSRSAGWPVRRSCWCRPARSRRALRRSAWPAGPRTSPPSRPPPAWGRACWSPSTPSRSRGTASRVGQVLLTAEDVVRRGHYVNARRTLERLLGLGVVPVVNENDTVATQEIRFGDNDRLAALVAHLVQADALVLLSDVDALYDGPPGRAGVRRVPLSAARATWRGCGSDRVGAAGVGSGGMVTKVEAAAIAASAGVPTLLTAAPLVARGPGGGGRRHLVHGPRGQARQPAAVARARRAHGGHAGARRRRRRGRGGPPHVPAAGRHHPGRGRVQRRRPRGAGGPGRPGGGPGAGELRRRRPAGPARPVHPGAGPRARRRRTSARWSTATTSCSSIGPSRWGASGWPPASTDAEPLGRVTLRRYEVSGCIRHAGRLRHAGGRFSPQSHDGPPCIWCT